MRRLLALTMAAVAILTLAAPVAAAGPQRFKESYSGTGFSAWASECGRSSCTDTNIWAERYTSSSGDEGTYVCVDVYSYPLHGRRDDYASGCTDGVALTVANDLSSASLGETSVELCDGRACSTVSVAASLTAIGASASYRAKGTSRDGTCTFTWTDVGVSRYGEGAIDYDGAVLAASGEIRSYESSYSERCR